MSGSGRILPVVVLAQPYVGAYEPNECRAKVVHKARHVIETMHFNIAAVRVENDTHQLTVVPVEACSADLGTCQEQGAGRWSIPRYSAGSDVDECVLENSHGRP
ncbi:hypothetical protein D9M72_508070 [compost metagenome]